MHPAVRPHRSTRRAWFGFTVLLLALVLAAISCTFLPAGDDALRQTDIALGIQQTLVAQTATALQVQSSAPTFTAAPPTSVPVVEAASPTPAAVEPTLPPTDTQAAATNTPVPVVSSEPVNIAEWRMFYWVPLGSGCKVAGTGCWKMEDDYKKHTGAGDLTLTSKVPIMIDASWPSPYLVFWHKHKFASTARIDISGNGVWSTMVNLTKKQSAENWVRGEIDLSMFKGKEILVSFAAMGIWGSGGIPGSDWFINDVQVVPDYQP
jgi:hypothetical protein